jgi:ELWxxDGT repeat protein
VIEMQPLRYVFLPVFWAWVAGVLAAQSALVADIRQTPFVNPGSNAAKFARVGGTVLFAARTDVTGVELWRTDGTAAGTALVTTAASQPAFLMSFGGVVVFP